MIYLEIQDLHKSFGGVKALNGINLTLEKESVVGLIGPNGSGKSTLFNVISGMLKPTKGSILFKNEPIHIHPPHIINQLGLSRSFQHTRLFNELTLIENLCLPPKKQPGEKLRNLFSFFSKHRRSVLIKEEEVLERAFRILEKLEIDHVAYEYTKNLSGGQKKLGDVGRILMSDPEILFLDEPTAGVNPVLAKKLFDIITSLRKSLNLTIMIIEHNMDLMMDTKIDLLHVANFGKIIASGQATEIKQSQEVIDAYLGG